MTTTSTADNTAPLTGSNDRIYPLGDGPALASATCVTLLGVLACFLGMQPFSANVLQRLSMLALAISLCLGAATAQQAEPGNIETIALSPMYPGSSLQGYAP
jgi:hypothetical protein